MSGPTLKKGWMKKQGRSGVVKNWKKRFFVLDNGKVFYYVDETDKPPYGENLKGDMSLVNTELVEENSRYNNKQIFIVSYNGENNMLMETDGPAETTEWIKAFKEHIAFSNVQTVENVFRESRRLPSEAVNSLLATANVSGDKTATPTSPSPNSGRALPPIKENEDSSESTRTSYTSSKNASTTATTTAATASPAVATAASTTTPTTTATAEMIRDSRASMRTVSIRLETEMDLPMLLNKVLESILSLGTDAQYRNEFIQKLVPRLLSTVKSFGENCLDGAIGNRGEKTVGMLTFLLFIILFTNAPKLSFLVRIFTKIFTTLLMLIGISLISNAVWELEDQNSIFLTPATNHKLVKTGIYRLVRHPIYGGVWLFTLGYSLAQEQVYKIVLTIVLFVILTQAAEIEEEHLERKHPKEYPTYASNKHVLIPFLY